MHDDDKQLVDDKDREIQALLQRYPAPAAAPDYFEQALIRATHEGSRRQRNRWLSAGFGSAVAAGLVLWMIGGLMFSTPPTPHLQPEIPTVVMTLEQPQTVKLVFAAATAMDMATLTVRLPDGIELSDFPGQREVSWETSLNKGRNLLPLKLIATSPIGGEVYAVLEHDDRGRTFALRVEVS